MNQAKTLTGDSKFRFSCHPGLSCFTECCRDVNIFLTPYDVLRMRKKLDLSSGEFLERYTIKLIGNKTGLPLVLLKMNEQDKKCPFVTPQGCGIYQERPWACRMFPLDKAEGDDRYNVVAVPSRCRGLEEDRELMVEEYIKEQGLLTYDYVEEIFNHISYNPRLSEIKVTDPQIADMFYMACYDLDRFKRFVFETRFLKIFEVEPEVVEQIKTDDLALMQLGFRWMRFGLVIGDSMKFNQEVLLAKQKEQEAANRPQ
ncbi:YkgJ family cysteine cluster protein [Desulfofundulus thermobenzoicus]|uniref:YkgJ family cysteine cluster protein n=1 Tax=Desulfofundulus thermobenzoicus TaxID=29376 RepID=A0A6N7IM31_9FIRM|nr:YkgJ family cysteine cluster protein [Desulfofundulus thermobenzoicus]MQL51025.1 YkgJ family cysteine cluster protein [Desulfofundulus thermobenzoicus]HHW42326.1 YkgJ family cysteine cluster protein [Desulfotomaculum sp.]